MLLHLPCTEATQEQEGGRGREGSDRGCGGVERLGVSGEEFAPCQLQQSKNSRR
jgi:hypothetical protein